MGKSWLPFADLSEEIVNKIDAINKSLPEVIQQHNNRNDSDESESDQSYMPFADWGMNNTGVPEIQSMLALPNNRVLSLAFNHVVYFYAGIWCPCSKIMEG